jgi:hypothetical protein
MVDFLLQWILAIIYVESLTEILIESELLFGFRNYLYKLSPGFLGKLFTCGYCMSIWIAISAAWALPGNISQVAWFDCVLRIFVLHRLSNILHELFSRWFKRLPWHVVLVKQAVLDDDSDLPDKIES